MYPSDISEQEYQEKSKYCSSLHGDPYPPCYNPKWTCEDCKKKWEKHPIGVTKESEKTKKGMTIETNYSIGQEVYFMHDNKVQCAKINEVNIKIMELCPQFCTDKAKCMYTLNFRTSDRNSLKVMDEKDLYPSKEELLKSL